MLPQSLILFLIFLLYSIVRTKVFVRISLKENLVSLLYMLFTNIQRILKFHTFFDNVLQIMI